MKRKKGNIIQKCKQGKNRFVKKERRNFFGIRTNAIYRK